MLLHTVDTGYFKLDGGAMFGVVPKSLWQSLNPADNNNMCTWAMRCLLIEDGNKLILIDTGLGEKYDAKFAKHFQPHGDITLCSAIHKLGYAIEEVSDVVLTHLHFDHCGGATHYNSEGMVVPSFPNATYWTHSRHWQWALQPNAREKASFLKENLLPIQESGQLMFIDTDIFSASESLTFDIVNGHTECMIIPHIHYKGKTITYAADLIPSRHHVRMPYVMAYDIRPLETLKEKESLLNDAFANNHILFLEHDKDVACCTLAQNDNGIYFDNANTLEYFL